MNLDELTWDAAGLVTVVVQDRHSGEVRMVAHANREAVERTVASGDAFFFSRSRNAMWRKGETSGNTLRVEEVWADCDGDALLYLVDPNGPSCHTGERNCFFRRLGEGDVSGRAAPTLARLWDVLEARRASTGEKSYTRSLLDGGVERIGGKIEEESGELVEALRNESDKRVVSEAGDVLYHAMVGLLARGVTLRDVEEHLSERFGASGHQEKASRKR